MTMSCCVQKTSITIRESKRDGIKVAVSAFPFRHVENLKLECLKVARLEGPLMLDKKL